MQLPPLSMKSVDHRAVAKEVYDFASSQAPLAPLVKEALGVIDDAIDCFGYVYAFDCTILLSSTLASQGHISISFNGGKDCESLLIMDDAYWVRLQRSEIKHDPPHSQETSPHF
jgi:FAD synthetase